MTAVRRRAQADSVLALARCAALHVGVVLVLALSGATFGQDELPEPAAAGLANELIGPPHGAPLAGDELDRVTEEVTSLMRCPVCQGLSVADSPTTSALAMREEARDLLALGYSGDQVLSYFERSYGEFIRLSPKPVGFNLVVWLLPGLGLVAGGLLVWWRVRRNSALQSQVRSQAPAKSVTSSEVPDDLATYAERVRREVGGGGHAE